MRGTADSESNIPPHQLNPSAWQCPVCGVGVRGDVEVCPNCVGRNGGQTQRGLAPEEKPKTRSGGVTGEDGLGMKRIISELRRNGIEDKY